MSGPVATPPDDRGPPPFPAGKPYEWNICAQRTPPIGWEFLRAAATEVAFVMPCPACEQGWVGLVPDGEPYGYAIAYELGCSRDCPADEIAWWHQFQLGSLPTPEPDERDRRYALAAARGAIRDLAKLPPTRDPAKAFARASYRVGQAKPLGRFDERQVARALVRAGTAMGLPPAEAAAIARRNTLAGAAAPLRGPR